MTTSAFVQDGPRLENSYASDWLLKSYLRRKLGPDLLAAIEPELLELLELGELAMGRLLELQRVDRRNEPTLTQCPRPNSRVTRCHLDHANANRIFMSRSNRPYGCGKKIRVSAR
jgi:hypothetical protein